MYRTQMTNEPCHQPRQAKIDVLHVATADLFRKSVARVLLQNGNICIFILHHCNSELCCLMHKKASIAIYTRLPLLYYNFVFQQRQMFGYKQPYILYSK